MNMSPANDSILPVTRTKAQAKRSYDRMSQFYDLFTGAFEQRFKNKALERMQITSGETILEIGFGTGQCLKLLAEAVGENGRVYGIDISSGMLAVSRRRLERAGLSNRVTLTCEDAMKMAYDDSQFDAVFMSFTLELFDTPEIPRLLGEVHRVLKPGGRVGVISMSKENSTLSFLKFYEWLHLRLPYFFDCRPIYVAQSIQSAGFEIQSTEQVNIYGLPGEIVIARKRSSQAQTAF